MSVAPYTTWIESRDSGTGWLCLGTIVGNPDRKEEHTFAEHWYQWPAQKDDALKEVATWIDQRFNIYNTPCLFSEPVRGYATALPTDKLWIDDAAIDGAELIQSSEGNYQSWLHLDRPISAAERKHLQTAIAAEHKADSCSGDAVHLARVPGGWNTKHEPWQVQIVRLAHKVFSVDELFTRYGQPDPAQAIRTPGKIEVRNEDWQNLPAGERLAQSPRFVRLREKNEDLNTVCEGGRVKLTYEDGREDDTANSARAVFFLQLVRAGYPMAEIRALWLHFEAQITSKPISAYDYKRDFARLEIRYKTTIDAYQPRVKPTRWMTPSEPMPAGGRYLEITAGQLLDYYFSIADSGPTGTIVDCNMLDAAHALGVSVSTIRRREHELASEGAITRVLSDDRQHSWVILGYVVPKRNAEPFIHTPYQIEESPGVPARTDELIANVLPKLDIAHSVAENAPEMGVCEEQAHVEQTQPSALSEAIATALAMPALLDSEPHSEAQRPSAAPIAAGPSWLGGCVASSPSQDTPPPDQVARSVSVDAAVAEAVAVYGMPPEPSAAQIAALLADTKRMAQLQRRKPNTPPEQLAFKAVKRQNVATYQAVYRKYVHDNTPGFRTDAINQALRTELLRRDLQTATPAMLRSQLRLFEKRYETQRKAKSRSSGWWWFAAELVKQEQQRRPADPGRTPRREQPPERALVQHVLDDAAWEALETYRARNPLKRVVPVAPTRPSAPVTPSTELVYDGGIVARLKDRLAANAGARQ